MVPSRLPALAPVVLLAACGAGTPDTGLRTRVDTVGDTVVVRTLSGSAWDSSRVLAEDLSIGVDEGAPEEMFGQLRSIDAKYSDAAGDVKELYQEISRIVDTVTANKKTKVPAS